jgi:hypothetical protein
MKLVFPFQFLEQVNVNPLLREDPTPRMVNLTFRVIEVIKEAH